MTDHSLPRHSFDDLNEWLRALNEFLGRQTEKSEHKIGQPGAVSEYGGPYTTYAYGVLIPWTMNSSDLEDYIGSSGLHLWERLEAGFPSKIVWRQYPKFYIAIGAEGVELVIRCRYHAL